jgi:ATP-dependent Lhr-like helicase
VPTIPRWGSNKFPLANRVAREIRRFRRELRIRLEARSSAAQLTAWIATRLDCGARNAAISHRVHAAQHGVSEIPTDEFRLVEEFVGEAEPILPDGSRAVPRDRAKRPRRGGPVPGESPDPGGQLAFAAVDLPAKSAAAKPRRPTPSPSAPPMGAVPRHYFFHTLIGRAANDALARVVGLRLGRLRGCDAIANADDYGFVVTVADPGRIVAGDLSALLSPDAFEADFLASVERSDLLKYHFRGAAQTGLMVYRNYFGERKAARKVQWSAEVIFNVLATHEPGHVLMREARRDAGHTFLDAPRALAYLADLREHARPVRLRSVAMVPPLSFGLYATRIQEALMAEDPRETLERLYHHWWARLEGSSVDREPGTQPTPKP